MKLIQTQDYLLLIEEVAEIRKNDNFLDLSDNTVWLNQDKTMSKILFPECIKIIAYYPLTKEAKELDLPLLPPFEKEEYIQKLAKEEIKFNHRNIKEKHEIGYRIGFDQGYKASQSKGQYSLEDMEKAFEYGKSLEPFDCFGDFIQSLSTQQLPSEFIPEYEDYKIDIPFGSGTRTEIHKKLKIITNSGGKEVLCGTYKY